MPLFCKQCNERRYPIVERKDRAPLWLCKSCKNYSDGDDVIVRTLAEGEGAEA